MTNLPIPQPEFESDSWSLIKRYFSTLKKLLIQPGDFFKLDWERSTVSSALTFALVTEWIGEGLQTLYANLIEMKALNFYPTEKFQTWANEVGSVLLSPFRTLLAIFILGALIFIAVRLLVRDTYHARYTKVVKIVSFTYAGSALLFIPVLGPILAKFVSFLIGIAAIREVYRTTTGSAILIVLFPSLLAILLFFGFIFLILSLLAAGALLFNSFG